MALPSDQILSLLFEAWLHINVKTLLQKDQAVFTFNFDLQTYLKISAFVLIMILKINLKHYLTNMFNRESDTSSKAVPEFLPHVKHTIPFTVPLGVLGAAAHSAITWDSWNQELPLPSSNGATGLSSKMRWPRHWGAYTQTRDTGGAPRWLQPSPDSTHLALSLPIFALFSPLFLQWYNFLKNKIQWD